MAANGFRRGIDHLERLRLRWLDPLAPDIELQIIAHRFVPDCMVRRWFSPFASQYDALSP
jgi:hypothetical protein